MTEKEALDMTSIDDIKARAEAATEGPWTYTGKDHQTTWIETPLEDVLIHDERGTGHMRENFSWIKEADAEFITHAREDIPKLLHALDVYAGSLNTFALERFNEIITEALA
jgi:hypothetical protein